MKILAPNRAYSGVTAGLTFVDGVAVADELPEHIVDWLRRNGYEVLGDEPKEANEPNESKERKRKER